MTKIVSSKALKFKCPEKRNYIWKISKKKVGIDEDFDLKKTKMFV